MSRLTISEALQGDLTKNIFEGTEVSSNFAFGIDVLGAGSLKTFQGMDIVRGTAVAGDRANAVGIQNLGLIETGKGSDLVEGFGTGGDLTIPSDTGGSGSGDGIGILNNGTLDVGNGNDTVTGIGRRASVNTSSNSSVTIGIYNIFGTILGGKGNDSFIGKATGDRTQIPSNSFGNQSIGILNNGLISGGQGRDNFVGTGTAGQQAGIPNLAVGISNDPSASLLGGSGRDRFEGIVVGMPGTANQFIGEAIGISNSGLLNAGPGQDIIKAVAVTDGRQLPGKTIGLFNRATGRIDMGSQADEISAKGNAVGFENAGNTTLGAGADTVLGEGVGKDADVLSGVGIKNTGSLEGGDGADHFIGKGQGFGIENAAAASLNMGKGRDSLTGTGGSVGINNAGQIFMGKGQDVVAGQGCDAFTGFSGGGRINLGDGRDKIIGFGTQTIDGGNGKDIAKFSFDLTDSVILGSNSAREIDITVNGQMMSFVDVESFSFNQSTFSLRELQNH